MFWDSLDPADRQAVEAAGTHRRYAVGTRLFHHGDAASHVLVILAGLVKLHRTAVEGREILIELRGTGELLGELSAIDDTVRNAAGVVVEPVEAIALPAETFRRLLMERGTVSYAVLKMVTSKLRQATDRRLEAGAGDTQARLCRRLVELARYGTTGSDGVIEIKSPLTQQELADWIGVSRDAVVLALRRIRAEGWIETGRRTIRILDLDALTAEAIEA